MAKCSRCLKWLLVNPKSGYCEECEKFLENQINSIKYTTVDEIEHKKESLCSDFDLRRGIHFGDNIETVKTKEKSIPEDEYEFKSEKKIAYRGTAEGVKEYGETIYTFDENNALVHMGYAFKYWMSEYEYTFKQRHKFSDLYVEFQKSLTERFGKPVYNYNIIHIVTKKLPDGAQYSTVVNTACSFDESFQYSGSQNVGDVHGWIINENENDIIIYLRQCQVKYLDHLELGYYIMSHDDVLRCSGKDIQKIAEI